MSTITAPDIFFEFDVDGGIGVIVSSPNIFFEFETSALLDPGIVQVNAPNVNFEFDVDGLVVIEAGVILNSNGLLFEFTPTSGVAVGTGVSSTPGPIFEFDVGGVVTEGIAPTDIIPTPETYFEFSIDGTVVLAAVTLIAPNIFFEFDIAGSVMVDLKESVRVMNLGADDRIYTPIAVPNRSIVLSENTRMVEMAAENRTMEISSPQTNYEQEDIFERSNR